ncbi:MAG: rhodanese-like domain-containing protein [Candidatus Bathyarchaeia archaeon]
MAKKALVVLTVLLTVSMLASQVNAWFPTRMPIPWHIVSTSWLKSALWLPNLVVLDIRDAESYSAGHIPGAINVPADLWYVNDPFTVPVETPWMEMPSKDELFGLIGSAGITGDSSVVVVGSTSGILEPVPLALYNTATITRVAITLLYAGVKNVAILDGGYEKWVADGYPIETKIITPTPVQYWGILDEKMLVSREYVYSKIGAPKTVIIDARDEIVYNCGYTEPWCKSPGHIPTAVNLPTPLLWDINVDEKGNVKYITYKDFWTLLSMGIKVAGWNWYKEIIVYCGVGGYASTTYFILKKVLGYYNVKFYDGSAQEWTHAGMPVECP